MWLKANASRANERASRLGNAKRRALEVLDRLHEDHLLGVRFAVNVFIASIIVWFMLRCFAETSPIWAIASMVASTEPVVKQGRECSAAA